MKTSEKSEVFFITIFVKRIAIFSIYHLDLINGKILKIKKLHLRPIKNINH